MRPDSFDESVLDYFADGLAPQRRRAALEHLDACAACRQLVLAVRDIDRRLRELAMPPPRLPSARALLERAGTEPGRT